MWEQYSKVRNMRWPLTGQQLIQRLVKFPHVYLIFCILDIPEHQVEFSPAAVIVDLGVA